MIRKTPDRKGERAMEIQQMWASPHLGKKGHYARFLLGSMGGILLVGLFLSVGGAILLMPLGTKKPSLPFSSAWAPPFSWVYWP